MEDMHNPNKLVQQPEVTQTWPDDVFVFPTSFAQQRLWFLDKLEPGSNVYNVPFAIRLTGRLDGEVLRHSLRELVRRHEALRTTFSESAEGEPVQVVSDRYDLDLPVADLRNVPQEAREE